MTTKGRISRRTAMAATAMTVFATPAFASMMIQSYMAADVNIVTTCLVTKAGSDVGSYNDPAGASVDFASAAVNNSRVDIQEDRVSVIGMQGDRVIYNDVARIQNTCDIPLSVSLKMDGSQGSGWADRYAEVYISSTATALDATTSLGYPTDNTANWTAQPLVVDSSGSPVQAQTSEVVLNPDQELRVATLVEAGMLPANLTDQSTVSWEVVAKADNGR